MIEFLQLVLKSNEKREEEIKNESIWSEVEKLREKWKLYRTS